MAIGYGRMTIISRSGGGNAVRSAAYMMRAALECERTGERFDYAGHADDLCHHEVLLPAGAAEAFRDAGQLWNEAQAMERRRDSQEAKSLILALPRELAAAEQVELARGFAIAHFVDHGVPVQLDVHDSGDGNPHAHLLIATRRLGPGGFEGRKARDLNPQIAYSRVVGSEDWGVRWAEYQNGYFLSHGLAHRVDATAAEPQPHLGPKAHRVVGEHPEIVRIREINAELCRDPERVLAALTRNNATFTAREVSRYLEKHAGPDEDGAALKAAVMKHPSVLRLYEAESGEFARRYTTVAVREQERRAIADAANLAERRHGLDPAAVESAAVGRGLREDQRVAFEHGCSGHGLVIIEGRAGTGKSYTAQTIREAHERDGWRVIGLAPTNKVARDLAAEGFAEARTCHSLLFRLNTGKEQLGGKTLVMVDEAAMVDSRVMGELLRRAEAASAKLVLIGDDRQLASIERGGLFSELRARHGSAEISQVTRQKADAEDVLVDRGLSREAARAVAAALAVDEREELVRRHGAEAEGHGVAWQRQAAADLAAGRFREALEAFDQHGAIHWRESKEAATAALIERWKEDSAADPAKSRFVLAYTNRDVDRLNRALREVRRERGEIGPGVEVETKHGRFAFSEGDRIQFTATDKALGFVNGNTGTIVAMAEEAGTITARLDGGKLVTWRPDEVNEHGELTGRGFRLGYAGTVYKSQGATIDRTYLLHTKHWRASSSYVALTRQRESAEIFVAAPEAWMAAAGGVDRLTAVQRARAEQSYARWREADPAAAARHAFPEYVDYVQRRHAERQPASPAGGTGEERLRRLAQQMSRSDERRASIAFATAEEVAAIGGIPPEAVRAPEWLIPPINPGTARPELSADAIAEVRARASRGPREMMNAAATVIYRDRAQALAAIQALVDQHGYQETAARLQADPAQAGELAGKDGGLFTDRAERQARAAALERVPDLADRLRRIEPMEEKAEADHRRHVAAQIERDAIGIPRLSAEDMQAVAALSAVSGQRLAAAWQALDPAARDRLEAVREAWNERFPFSRGPAEQDESMRRSGADAETIRSVRHAVQAVGAAGHIANELAAEWQALEAGRDSRRQSAAAAAIEPETVAAIPAEKPEMPQAREWMVPPIDPGAARPELAADAIAQVRAEASRGPREMMNAAATVIYRDRGQALAAIQTLVDQHGYQETAARLQADPGQAGELAGKDGGLFTGRADRQARAAALERVPDLADRLRRIEPMEEKAEADHRRHVAAQIERDAIGIPRLSAEDMQAVAALSAVSGRQLAAAWQALDPAVRDRLAAVREAWNERFPFSRGPAEQDESMRRSGADTAAIRSVRHAVQAVGEAQHTMEQQERQSLGYRQGRGYRHSV